MVPDTVGGAAWCLHAIRSVGCVSARRRRWLIISSRSGRAGDWSLKNGQGLCASCHGRKTVLEDGGLGRPAREGAGRISGGQGLGTGRPAVKKMSQKSA